MSHMDHKQAREEVKSGRPVAFNGKEIRDVRDLPSPDAEGAYVALRSPTGSLSRAGMEHVIDQGGSVLHGGTIISTKGDLPAEEVLAAGDANRLKAVADAADEQIALLMAQKARAEKARQEAEEQAKRRAAEPTEEKETAHRGRPHRAKKEGEE